MTATSANVATDDEVIPVRTGADVQLMRRSLIGQAGLLAVGALSAIQVANISVTALSLVCLLVVPGFLLMRHRGVDLVPLVLAASGWISFLASCLVNEVSVVWPNAMAPAGFSLYLMGFTVLTGRSVDRTATLLAGVAAGSVGFFVFQGIDLTHTGGFGNLWKYGIAHAVTILVLYGLIKARVAPLVPAIALALLGLMSLGLNFRSHALVCLLAAAVFFAHRFLGSWLRRGWRFAVMIVFGLLFAYVMPMVARTGLFGTALQKKTVEQDATNLPLLLVGRTEPPMNIAAILQHPILGWGSGQNFTTELYTHAEHLAVRMGYPATFPFDVYWRLPVFDYSATHSVLMGSWAEGGVLAVLLPLWLLAACLGIVWNYPRFGAWAPLAVTVGLQGIWDLMYTSWTYNMIPEHACIALLFCAVHFRKAPSPP